MARGGGKPQPTITDDRALGAADIQRSLRFTIDDSTYLGRTSASASSTFTLSLWLKRGICTANDSRWQYIFAAGNNGLYFERRGGGFQIYGTGGEITVATNFRDPSSWYHIVLSMNSGTATTYVNNSVVHNAVAGFSLTTGSDETRLGRRGNGDYPFDGYMAEVHLVDGQAYDPSYFGFTDPQTGIWMPKRYEGAYGTNGFYLDFSDNSSTATLGIDKSPNGNDFTLNNIDVNDSVKDTPTNAFATLNSIVYADANFKEGNLYFDPPDTHKTAYANIAVNSGKWYWEAKAIGGSLTKWTYGVSDVKNIGVGQISGSNRLLAVSSGSPSDGSYSQGDAVSIYKDAKKKNGSHAGNIDGYTIAQGDVVAIALDVDAGKVWYRIGDGIGGSQTPGSWLNGVTNNTYNSTTLSESGHDATLTTGETYVPAFSGESADWQVNFGQDDSFSGTSTSQGNEDENGLGSFYYAVPSGFKALCTKNLLPNVSSIIRPQRHFECVTFTGNGSTGQSITSLEFQPDLIWFKSRSHARNHSWWSSVVGRTKGLFGDVDEAEFTSAAGRDLASFDTSGFTVGEPENSSSTNNNGESLVAWCWKAGGSSNTFNVDDVGYANASAAGITDGSIALTGASVNREAGFSMVTYTGTGSTGTVGHGFTKTPKVVITKSRSASGSWNYLDVVGNSTAEYGLFLNDNGGYTSYQGGTYWADTLPTSTVFTVNSNASTNASGVTYIAYCWTDIPGYSKMGRYIGNASTDGSYVHLGFRPAFVLLKRTSASASWVVHDNKRAGYNGDNDYLHPDNNQSESDGSSGTIDFLSNGFKLRMTAGTHNDGTFIYMAFAEQPGTTPFDTFPNAR